MAANDTVKAADVRPGVRLASWGALLLVSSLAVAGRVSAGAESSVAFRAVAAAEGVRIGVVAEGGPVTNHVIDGASPIAQAAVDSTSGSAALGSVAYPGDLVVTAPGLVAGFSGGQTSGVIPPYPLIAAAGSTTTPESRAEAPGSTMHAAAGERHADAGATSGSPTPDGGGPTMSATSSVVAGDDDVVTATASSEVSSVTVGPLVLGHISARSTATRAPGAEVTRKASFEATGIAVSGVEVRLTEDGLVVGGSATPIDRSSLQPILDGAGITIRSIDQVETPDGIMSAGLVVTLRQDLPAAITPAIVTYTFGRAAASVSTVSLPATEVVVSEPGAPAAGGAPASMGGSPGGSAATPGPPAAPIAAAPAEASAPPAAERIADTDQLFDLTTFYLVLVVAAACAGMILELLRHVGVRLRWT